MLNETPVEEVKTKWYNTKKFKLSLTAIGVIAGIVICGVVVKQSNQRLDTNSEPAKEVLRALADVGAETFNNAGEGLDNVTEKLGK